MATIRKAFAWFKSFKNRVKKFCYRAKSLLKEACKSTGDSSATKSPQNDGGLDANTTELGRDGGLKTNASKLGKEGILTASAPELEGGSLKANATELGKDAGLEANPTEFCGKDNAPKKNIDLSVPLPQKHKKKMLLPREEDFENFYKKWNRFHGPTLTFMDRKFLESLGDEFFEFEENAWKVLASPYLKAIYNGLESIRKIDDLLVLDQKAKDKIKPFILDCIEGRPETLDRVIGIVYDKVTFETRYGRKRLSLDPRIVPLWLGLSA